MAKHRVMTRAEMVNKYGAGWMFECGHGNNDCTIMYHPNHNREQNRG